MLKELPAYGLHVIVLAASLIVFGVYATIVTYIEANRGRND